MKCPRCGKELRRSEKYPNYGLCDNCKKKYIWSDPKTDHKKNGMNKTKSFKKIAPAIFALMGIIVLIIISYAIDGRKKEEATTSQYYWQKYYEIADFEKFKTPASENGLDGTLIAIIGTVTEVEENDSVATIMVEDRQHHLWVASLGGEDPLPDVGDDISIYGSYLGVAQAYNNYPGIVTSRYINKKTVTNATYDGAPMYIGLEGYPNKSIEKIIESTEKRGVYDIYLTTNAGWDDLSFSEQSDLADECIDYCADLAAAMSLSRFELNIRGVTPRGDNAFFFSGGDEIKLYVDGIYDSSYVVY